MLHYMQLKLSEVPCSFDFSTNFSRTPNFIHWSSAMRHLIQYFFLKLILRYNKNNDKYLYFW